MIKFVSLDLREAREDMALANIFFTSVYKKEIMFEQKTAEQISEIFLVCVALHRQFFSHKVIRKV